MDNIEEDKDLILDFSKLNEDLAYEGAKLRNLLRALLGHEQYYRMFPVSTPRYIRGTRSQVDSFTNAVSGERRYMNAVRKHGLNDPKTFASKSKLDRAIKNFERETGMKWPLK